MKFLSKTVLSLSCALLATMACAQDFTLKVNVPGMKAGCKAKVESVAGNNKNDLSHGTTTNGTLVLTGTISGPTLVELSIDDKPSYADGEYAESRGAKFYLEPGIVTTVTAAAFDSLPRSYEMGSTPLWLEPRVMVKGGSAQQHYQEWRDYIYQAELAAWQAGHVRWLTMFGEHKGNPLMRLKDDERESDPLMLLMQRSAAAATAVVSEMNRRFATLHPDYAISIPLQQRLLENMFMFSADDLDRIAQAFRNNEDATGVKAFSEQIAQLRKFVKGTPVTDFTVTTPDGTAKKFTDYLSKDKYTFVDLWASWCGPCRAAIPKVKQMAHKLSDKLNVISISVDQKAPDWQRAMKEEAMPWPQMIATREATKVLQQAYNLQAIPYLLLISPDGKIVASAHDPAEIEQLLLQDSTGQTRAK